MPTMMRDAAISFPMLGDWSIDPSASFTLFGHTFYWYGAIIAVGFILAMLYCARHCRRCGIKPDTLYDFLIWMIPLAIIGARLYYVIFYLDLFKKSDGSFDWSSAVAIWDGGLAIYGAVIAAILVGVVLCKKKGMKLGALTDLVVMGFLIGQTVGRWGNFMNREAFGTETTLPWRMELTTVLGKTVDVHPTFLYESLWNVVGLLLIVFIISKARRFDGENTWFYFLWYGIGRFWIEGLRTDSLYLFDWTIGDQPIRVSQALSLVMVLVSAFMLFYNIKLRPHKREELYVNIVAARKAAAAADSEADTVEASTPAAAEPAAAPVTDAGRTEPVSEPTDAASEVPEAPTAPETPAEPQGPTE